MSTADDLPDDVVERAALALFPGESEDEAWADWRRETARHHLNVLRDAGIVALVPDPDTDADAVHALRMAMFAGSPDNTPAAVHHRLQREGWTVAPLPVQRREPCEFCTDGWVSEPPQFGEDANVDWGHECSECEGTGEWSDEGTPCSTCDGSGERPADPQQEVWQEVYGEGGQPTRQGVLCPSCFIDDAEAAGVTLPPGTPGWFVPRDTPAPEPHPRPTEGTPPAVDLPGDGWVRYRVGGDGDLLVLGLEGQWMDVLDPAEWFKLHPDPEPEPEPRPTDGWASPVTTRREGRDGTGLPGWVWSLHDSGGLVEAGTEPTREEAEDAAAQALTAWDARLAGGAS